MNFQTAHLALTRRGRLAEGEAVLVHGAAGGVGTACIQVARALGAGTIIGVASGRERMAVAMAAGADHALDAGEDWVSAGARAHRRPRRRRRVRSRSAARRSASRCAAWRRRAGCSSSASPTGTIPSVEANRLLLRHPRSSASTGAACCRSTRSSRSAPRATCTAGSRRGYLRPVVGERYRLEDGARALEDFAARRVTGKPVLLVR